MGLKNFLTEKLRARKAQASFEYFVLFTVVSVAVLVSTFLYFVREGDGQIHARGQLRTVAEGYFNSMVAKILQ